MPINWIALGTKFKIIPPTHTFPFPPSDHTLAYTTKINFFPLHFNKFLEENLSKSPSFSQLLPVVIPSWYHTIPSVPIIGDVKWKSPWYINQSQQCYDSILHKWDLCAALGPKTTTKVAAGNFYYDMDADDEPYISIKKASVSEPPVSLTRDSIISTTRKSPSAIQPCLNPPTRCGELPSLPLQASSCSWSHPIGGLSWIEAQSHPAAKFYWSKWQVHVLWGGDRNRGWASQVRRVTIFPSSSHSWSHPIGSLSWIDAPSPCQASAKFCWSK